MLAMLAAGASSGCRKHKTDEQLLREKVDCVAVHLYVATKVAVLRAPSDPSARNAKAQLMAAIESGGRVLRAIEARANGQDAGAIEAPRVTVTAGDLVHFGAALWALRAEGARIVRSDHEDQMQPILPALLTGRREVPYWAAHIDVNTEHAMFFIVLLALRLNPRVPVPIPPELILYEAWRTDAARVQIPGFETTIRGAKAYTYATHGLCDLASHEAAAMDRIQWNAAAAQRGFSTLTSGRAPRDEQMRAADATFRALGHGSSAVCYARRGDEAPMKEELRRFVESLHAMGVAPEETAVIRAFLAHENHDDAGARRALDEARPMRDLDPETRARIEAMDRALAANDRGAIQRQFDRGQLAVLTARVVYRQIERTGVFDQLAQDPTIVRVRSYLTLTGQTVDHARSTLGATTGEAERGARGWFRRFRR
jgi:hypothetical protein